MPERAPAASDDVTRPDLYLRRRVAVFGSGKFPAKHSLHRAAATLGRKLAEAGCLVLCGGFSGLLGSVGRGAREAGGEVVAFTVESVGDEVSPPVATEEVRHVDPIARLRDCLETADAYVVLPGGSGTLAELGVAWGLVKAYPSPHGVPPLMVWREPWSRILEALAESPGFWKPDLSHLTWISNPLEVIDVLEERVRTGLALIRHADTTPGRGAALRAYLASSYKNVRTTFAGLEPTVWRPSGVAPDRAGVEAVAARLLEVSPALVEGLDDVPFQEVVQATDRGFRTEFKGPEGLEMKIAARTRQVLIPGRTAGVREYVAQGRRDGKGRCTQVVDHVLRVYDLRAGWVVTLQVGTGPHAAVSAPTPRLAQHLRQRVDAVLVPGGSPVR